ncbi:Uncharacterised protein [Mycobacteroides abscessus subsp. abscessus]|nr:Uncharacterised protein [Mycobacteroides abscessus subsp. abscessus]
MISAAPSSISYGLDTPTCDHSTAIGVRSPYLVNSVVSDGSGICVGIALAKPKLSN